MLNEFSRTLRTHSRAAHGAKVRVPLDIGTMLRSGTAAAQSGVSAVAERMTISHSTDAGSMAGRTNTV